MNKKRNLEKELGITNNGGISPFEIDTEIIKFKVHGFLSSQENERKILRMKQARKTALIAAAVVLVLGMSAFAATKLFVSTCFSSSSGNPEYTSIPTSEMVNEDIGYNAVIVKEFSNGYKFDNGSIVSNNLKDENDSAEQFKSVSFRYEKDGDIVNFCQGKYNSETAIPGNIIDIFDGTDIYSMGYTNKVVPTDYEKTKEDIAAEENGELVFSYGSNDVEILDVKAITWAEGDMHYNLMQINGELSEANLVEMAKEIIAK